MHRRPITRNKAVTALRQRGVEREGRREAARGWGVGDREGEGGGEEDLAGCCELTYLPFLHIYP